MNYTAIHIEDDVKVCVETGVEIIDVETLAPTIKNPRNKRVFVSAKMAAIRRQALGRRPFRGPRRC